MSVAPWRKLLIVDDEPDMRLGLRMVLEEEYLITEAASGIEGLAKARKEIYPVVILDLVMEGMSGVEVLQHLRSENERQRVIILTGQGCRESAISAVNMGAFKYILKPVGAGPIRAAVKEAFERYDRDSLTTTQELKDPKQLHHLGLSDREAEVAFWVVQGDANMEIADRLKISHRTVEKHLQAIQEALGVNRRIKIAPRLREMGLH